MKALAVIAAKHKPVIAKTATVSYSPATFEQHKVANFYEVETAAELLEKVKPVEFMGRKFISFDTETHPYFNNSLQAPETVVRRWVGTGKKAVPQDYPFCFSICDGTNAFTIYNADQFSALAPLFEDPTIEKIAHNAKFDMHQFANLGMKIVGKIHDTVVLAKIVDENRTSYKLRDIAAHKPGGITKFEFMVDAYKQTEKVTDYRDIPKPLLTQYANADVWNCMLTFLDEYPRLVKDELEDLYNTELEAMVALYAMERYGMRVDAEYESTLKDTLQKLTDDAERAIYETAGRMFNINSGRQLYDVLVATGVNQSWIQTSAKGNPVLDKNALAALANTHNVEVVKHILDFRKYEKLLGTYAIGIYEQRDAAGRVHGNINQTEATTGRMSITKPALQTLPKKDKSIRRAFIPSDGFQLWFMDLDQIEYRLFAHYAKAEGLLQAIRNGYDVHAATAAIIFHKDLDDLTVRLKAEEAQASEMRAKGKTINFALIYGVGQNHLRDLLGVTATEAAELKATYFAQIPEARPFINTVHNVIKRRGFVKNFYGRRRHLDVDDCYKAPNSLIQGCAADYIKSKLVDIYKYLMYYKLESRMINIVHDEVVFEIADKEQCLAPTFRWLLSDFKSFRCPITAGAAKGNPSWGQKSDVDIGFIEPADKQYLSYDVFDGSVFSINRR